MLSHEGNRHDETLDLAWRTSREVCIAIDARYARKVCISAEELAGDNLLLR
jgi:hypothetical protein